MLRILFLSMFISSVQLDNEVLKSFSYTFGLKMFECGEKTNYTHDMARDILNFWKSSYSLTHEATGCLILCAMMRLELLDEQGNLAVENAKGFAMASGGDDSMVKFLIDLYSRCRQDTITIVKGCKAALELSKCFRHGIGESHMTPDINSLLLIPHD